MNFMFSKDIHRQRCSCSVYWEMG